VTAARLGSLILASSGDRASASTRPAAGSRSRGPSSFFGHLPRSPRPLDFLHSATTSSDEEKAVVEHDPEMRNVAADRTQRWRWHRIAEEALRAAEASALPYEWRSRCWRHADPEDFALEAVIAATGVTPDEGSRRGDAGWALIAHRIIPAVSDLAFELFRELESNATCEVADAAESAHAAALDVARARGADEDQADDEAEEAAWYAVEEKADELLSEAYRAILALLTRTAKKKTREQCLHAWREPFQRSVPIPLRVPIRRLSSNRQRHARRAGRRVSRARAPARRGPGDPDLEVRRRLGGRRR
jgi:hypothetical protein